LRQTRHVTPIESRFRSTETSVRITNFIRDETKDDEKGDGHVALMREEEQFIQDVDW